MRTLCWTGCPFPLDTNATSDPVLRRMHRGAICYRCLQDLRLTLGCPSGWSPQGVKKDELKRGFRGKSSPGRDFWFVTSACEIYTGRHHKVHTTRVQVLHSGYKLIQSRWKLSWQASDTLETAESIGRRDTVCIEEVQHGWGLKRSWVRCLNVSYTSGVTCVLLK